MIHLTSLSIPIKPMHTVNMEIFAGILFSRIAFKDIFVKLKNWRLGHDLPISVNNRVISRGFYFHVTSQNFRIYSSIIKGLQGTYP